VVVLAPGALPTSLGPYVAAMATGFVIGILGHAVRSRILIICGIVIVGAVAVIIAFVLGKLGQ